MSLPPRPGGFWKWELDGEDYRAVLDVDEVVRNTIANMRRLEEQATTGTVVDYLRSKGWICIEPKEYEDG